MIQVYSAQEFYTLESDYMNRLDPAWMSDGWKATLGEEMERFRTIMGETRQIRILDCSCGTGRQAVALAKLGHQVTASDLTQAALDLARQHASAEGVVDATGASAAESGSIDFMACDMRELDRRFPPLFDWVVTCMALDNLIEETGILQALQSMSAVLKPGGQVYIRLRNFDQVMEDRPRYEFKEERKVPFGRVIKIEDWDYESETQMVHIYAYLREDSRHPEYWDSDVFAYRRRVLRKADMEGMLHSVGFEQVQFLPQPNRWYPYEAIARKPGA